MGRQELGVIPILWMGIKHVKAPNNQKKNYLISTDREMLIIALVTCGCGSPKWSGNKLEYCVL